MKRFFSAVLAAMFICLLFAGCDEKGGIEFVSGEIVKNEENSIVNFTLLNNTGKTIYSLAVTVKAFSDKENVSDEREIVYPIEVENGVKATFSMQTDKKCVSAKAVSYSYKEERGAEKSGKFSEEFSAYVKKTASSQIKTREQLAEEIIRDVNNQFLKKGSLSTGSYDSKKKHLVIVSKYKDDYETCLNSYNHDPDAWKSLTDGIIQMSQTCREEFENNNFDDVNVSVGIISSDEEIMFSATNGNLMETLDSQ